jgi:DHA1 family bicyclomycin/chloramphenicol resistance-like MFS transporter
MTAAPPRSAVRRTTEAPTVGFVILVGMLALLPAVTTDMYLPSLPDVAVDLAADEAAVQLTITGMLIGGAVGQLFVGPFSDRVGRRRPVLIGVGLHVVLSLLCVVAETITQLVALRVAQGAASAGATVVAMAVIRDRYSGAEAARLMSRLMLVIAVAPLLAPTVGGIIAEQWDWRAVFVALAVFAAAMWLVVARFLPETLPVERRRAAHGIGTSLRGYLELLRDGRFVALASIPGLGMAVIMSYVAGSPFVLQQGYGLSPQQFALVFAVGGTSLVVGSQANAALVRRVGPLRLLRVGLPSAGVFAALLVVVATGRIGGIAGFVAVLWVTFTLLGFVMSNASALALTRHGDRAGTAAAVIGFMQAGLAGLVSPLVGVTGGDARAMTGVMVASIAAAMVVLTVGARAYRRGAWLELHDADATPAPAD